MKANLACNLPGREAMVHLMAAITTKRGRIGFLESGSGGQLPVIFLHGVGSDKGVWHPQLQYFGRSRRAVAFDYPGYGESDFIEGATRDDYAIAILAAMDALGIGRAHVCGLSLGGVIAIALHSAAPERCASLVLADSFAVHPEGQAIYQRSVAASQAMTMREIAEARAGALLGSAATPQIMKEVVDTMARIDPAAYRLGAAAVWLADQRERASAISCPALVLVGDEDAITPPALSRELQQLVRGARFELVERAGHLTNLEQPAIFNEAVESVVSA